MCYQLLHGSDELETIQCKVLQVRRVNRSRKCVSESEGKPTIGPKNTNLAEGVEYDQHWSQFDKQLQRTNRKNGVSYQRPGRPFLMTDRPEKTLTWYI